jgi:CheY-like chemotaxis protein
MTKPLRILVVEDEVIIAYLMAETLECMGHEVCAIEGSQAGAIAAARLHQPDLMIVDEHLGAGSGLAVVEAVLRSGPTPHIFVSGDTVRIKRLMPDAVVLEKPYRETDLARAIRRAMVPNGPSALQIDPPNEGAISPPMLSRNEAGCLLEPSRAQIGTNDIGWVGWLKRRHRGSAILRNSLHATDGGRLPSGGAFGRHGLSASLAD